MKIVKIISIFGASIQILGGVFSVYALIKRSADPNYNLLLSASIAIPLILLNFIGSILLIKTNSPKGVILILSNYLLQIIQFQLKGIYFFYALGPYLGFGLVKKVGQSISFWWDSSEFIFFQLIKLVDDKVGGFITINVVAIFFFVVLILEYKNRKAIEEHQNVNAED